MNNIKNIQSINEQELNAGIIGGLSKGSWHETYKDSAWVFLGGFPTELSEGDIICVMSQWGEIEDINLVRDKVTNKSKGFAFIKYEDNRSTILAVDNFNGMKLLGRTLRCDHVEEYKLPKDVREKEMEALENNPDGKVDIGPGHAYKHIELADDHDVVKGVDLWRQPKSSNTSGTAGARADTEDSGRDNNNDDHKHKKHKKDKKEEKKHKHKKDKNERDDRKRSKDSREDTDSPKRHRDRSPVDEFRREREPDRSRSDARAHSTAPYAPMVRPAPSSNGASAAPFATGAVASWRGNRDPAAAMATGAVGGSALGKRDFGGSGGGSNGGAVAGAGGVPRRDLAPSGIGGANRIR